MQSFCPLKIEITEFPGGFHPKIIKLQSAFCNLTLCSHYSGLGFGLARKRYLIGLLFIHKNGDFGMISVYGGEAPPIS